MPYTLPLCHDCNDYDAAGAPIARPGESGHRGGRAPRTVTEYVRTAARDAALTDLARSVIVSAETFDALLAALDSPPAPNPAMDHAHLRAAELGL